MTKTIIYRPCYTADDLVFRSEGQSTFWKHFWLLFFIFEFKTSQPCLIQNNWLLRLQMLGSVLL